MEPAMEPAYETEGGAPAVCDKLTELCDGVLTVVLGPEPEKSVLSVLELGTATDRCAVRTVEGVAVTGKAVLPPCPVTSCVWDRAPQELH